MNHFQNDNTCSINFNRDHVLNDRAVYCLENIDAQIIFEKVFLISNKRYIVFILEY